MSGVTGSSLVVVKVGGSLLDMPDLGGRLEAYLHGLDYEQIVVFCGGGPVADLVRLHDRAADWTDEKGHWLAVRSLTFTSQLIRGMIEEAPFVGCPAEVHEQTARIVVVDPYRFLRGDERSGDPLPKNWSVTSDSIAVRLAKRLKAAELILLKSVGFAGTVEQAARDGIVDGQLPLEVAGDSNPRITIVNFRRH